MISQPPTALIKTHLKEWSVLKKYILIQWNEKEVDRRENMETQKLVKLIFKDWMKVKYFLGKAPNELFLDFKKRFNTVCIQLILLVA